MICAGASASPNTTASSRARRICAGTLYAVIRLFFCLTPDLHREFEFYNEARDNWFSLSFFELLQMAALQIDIDDDFAHNPPGNGNAERIRSIIEFTHELQTMDAHRIRAHPAGGGPLIQDRAGRNPGQHGWMGMHRVAPANRFAYGHDFVHLHKLATATVAHFRKMENLISDQQKRPYTGLFIGNVRDSEERVILIPFVHSMRLNGRILEMFMKESIENMDGALISNIKYTECFKNSFVVYPPHKAWFKARQKFIPEYKSLHPRSNRADLLGALMMERRCFFRNAVRGRGFLTSLGCFYEPNSSMHRIPRNDERYREYMKFTDWILLTREAINLLANIIVYDEQNTVSSDTWRNIIRIMKNAAEHANQMKKNFRDAFSHAFSVFLTDKIQVPNPIDFVSNLCMWTFPDLDITSCSVENTMCLPNNQNAHAYYKHCADEVYVLNEKFLERSANIMETEIGAAIFRASGPYNLHDETGELKLNPEYKLEDDWESFRSTIYRRIFHDAHFTYHGTTYQVFNDNFTIGTAGKQLFELAMNNSRSISYEYTVQLAPGKGRAQGDCEAPHHTSTAEAIAKLLQSPSLIST